MRDLNKKAKLAKQILDEFSKDSIDKRRCQSNWIRQTRSYRLITPLFGGGFRAGENDPSKLIRETSVRGQLRFWWRAVRGAGTLEEIKSCEDAIFGNSNQKVGVSKVAIKVTVTKRGTCEELFESKEKNPKPLEKWKDVAYSAFPAAANNNSSVQKKVSTGVEFELKIDFPSVIITEIEAALWAWETFGGIGARTRRGFGALELVSLEDNDNRKEIQKYQADTAKEEIQKDFEHHAVLPRPQVDGLPVILAAADDLQVRTAKNPRDAWGYAVNRLGRFRQFRRDKNTHEVSDYGKSQWPEPSVIRAFHSGGQTPAVDTMPRAAFGLPIIFHFPQRDLSLPDHELNLVEHDRLASPLIIKPIACSVRAVAIALLMKPVLPSEQRFELKSENGKRKASTTLTASEATDLTKAGLSPLNGNPDVLRAFLNYFADESS